MKKILLLYISSALIILVMLFPFRTNAAVTLFNFGGRITYVTLCTCSVPNLYIYVVGPKPGAFVYVFGASISYMWYILYEGVATKGIYTPSTGQCWMVGEPCVLWPTIGQIKIIGTSLE